MMKPPLKLGFSDTFGTAITFFTNVLSQRYTIIRDDVFPDYLIFGDSNFGENHWSFTGKCKKIFYTGENVRPNYFTYDHAITFDLESSPKHYRLPLYVLEMDMMRWEGVVDSFDWLVTERPKTDWEKVMAEQRTICTYLQGNPRCVTRTQFVEFLLSKNKAVDCGGAHLNNIGRIIPRNIHDTIKFLKSGMFNIAFENGSFPGYTTEKLLNCFYARTLPIYWGNPMVVRDFNDHAMINCHNYVSFDEVLSYIDHLRETPKEYLDILSQPAFVNNVPNKYTDLDAFLNWWDTFVYE